MARSNGWTTAPEQIPELGPRSVQNDIDEEPCPQNELMTKVRQHAIR